MDHISFEFKVISCKDIKSFNFFQKPSVYAVVSIFNDNLKKRRKKNKMAEEERQQQQSYLQKHKTPVDKQGGRNPEWNHTVQIDMKAKSLDDSSICSHLYLQFRIFRRGFCYDRNIGEVRVSFKDLVDEFDGNVRFLCYQIRTTKDRKPNGVLNFSYRINGISRKIGTENHVVPEKVHYPSLDFLNKQHSCLFPEKVHYPSVDVLGKQSSEMCFPPASPNFPKQAREFNILTTSQSPPLSAMASPVLYHCPSPAQEFYSMSTPPSPCPAFPMNHHDPYHPPFPVSPARIPCTSAYSPEPINHGYHLQGY